MSLYQVLNFFKLKKVQIKVKKIVCSLSTHYKIKPEVQLFDKKENMLSLLVYLVKVYIHKGRR